MFRSSRALLLATGLAFNSGAEEGVDTSIRAGDDFFAYANGEWLATAKIPAGKARWSARNEIAERTAMQVEQVISSAPAGRVSDFRDAYLDEAGIEKRGIAPIAPLLRSIDGLHDRNALARWLGSQLRADVDPLNLGTYDSTHVFGLATSFGIHGEREYIPYLVQGGLGLGSRAPYLDDSQAGQEARAQYRRRIARMMEGAGFSQSADRASAVLALETELARIHANPEVSSNERNADNHWRVVDFPRDAPGLNWPLFFKAAGLTQPVEIVVWQPDAIKGTAALVGSQRLSVWKDYLRFHAILRFSEVLPKSMADPSTVPRSQRAIDATNKALPEAVGRLYVARYFPPAAKARVQAIVGRVVASFRKRVAEAPWMTPASREVALKKLDLMYFGVGYPDKWRDDSRLRIDRRDPVGNLQRIDEWNYRDTLARIGQPIDRHDWSVAPQWPGGVLNFQLNTYNFAAALLQPPRFDPEGSDAANFGSIGAIFGHEISHYVDTLGADYDVRGAMRNWWSDEDKAGFAAATLPIVEQFSAYRALPDLPVDGKLTLTENVADLGGVATAFDAYRAALEQWATEPDAMRKQDRQFFIGYARSWRSKVTEEALRAQVKGDGHAPDPFHVATVRNLDAWYEAFDVQPGQRLYLPPGSRVRVW